MLINSHIRVCRLPGILLHNARARDQALCNRITASQGLFRCQLTATSQHSETAWIVQAVE